VVWLGARLCWESCLKGISTLVCLLLLLSSSFRLTGCIWGLRSPAKAFSQQIAPNQPKSGAMRQITSFLPSTRSARLSFDA
jgi:hypothetical protein